MDQFVASISADIDWLRIGVRHACASSPTHDLYVTPTLTQSYRFVVWQRETPHEIIAWGEADTREEAMAEAARSLLN